MRHGKLENGSASKTRMDKRYNAFGTHTKLKVVQVPHLLVVPKVLGILSQI